MDLAAYLEQKSAVIEDTLREIFSSMGHVPGILRDAMEYMVFAGGKRVRPTLAITACECQDADSTVVLPFAAAIEMIHTYSLIHDDLPSLDNDDMRRGRPTCHKVFGEAIAVLAGDGLLTEAFRVMTNTRFAGNIKPDTINQVVYEIATAAGADGMVGGQVMDVVYEGKEGTKEILNYIHNYKTAAMIRVSVRTGALLGGAKDPELKGFTRYGECIGLAFQIMDDLLDATGDEKKVGKKLKKDDNKQTYIKHYGIDASRQRLAQLTEEAVQSINFLGERSLILKEIAQFIGNRTT